MAFDPNSPPASARFYYEADKIGGSPSNGSALSVWNDASLAGGHNLAGTAGITYLDGAHGIAGNPAVHSDGGSGHFMRCTSFTPIAQPMHIFIVAKAATGAGGFLLDGDSHRMTVVQNTLGNGLHLYSGTVLDAGDADNWGNNPRLIEGFFNGASSTISKNNTLLATGNAGADSLDAVILFAGVGTGEIAAAISLAIGFDSTATPTELSDFRTYAFNKYVAAATVPDAPSSLTATATANGIDLAWVGSTTTGNSAATGYKVYRTANGGGAGTETLLATLGNVLYYNDLVTSGSYRYTVTGTNATGEGVASNEAGPSSVIAATSLVIWAGNSLTAGYQNSTGEHGGMSGLAPNVNASRFLDPVSQMLDIVGAGVWKALNGGVDSIATLGGAVSPDLTTRGTTVIDPLFDGTAFSTAQVCVLWEITNDIYSNSAGAAGYGATAYANARAYCLARRAAGWKVVIGTCLPRNNSVPANFEANRIQANSLIRANWREFADAIADVGADGRIGQPGQYSNLTYYNADQCHLTDAGYGIIAQYMATAVLAAATSSSGATTLSLSINTDGSGHPVLTWIANPGAVHYLVLRFATATGAPTKVAVVDAPTVTYTDVGGSSGDFYAIVSTNG